MRRIPPQKHRVASTLSRQLAYTSGDEKDADRPSVGDRPLGNENVADVRDGLTRRERVVLYVLHETQKERGDRNVPTAMLWGRVCEHFYISPEELSEMLARLGARR